MTRPTAAPAAHDAPDAAAPPRPSATAAPDAAAPAQDAAAPPRPAAPAAPQAAAVSGRHAGPAIALAGLGLTLASGSGPVEILRGVDLTLAPGQRVGIVGPSGSGKSSLLMVMAGLERATAGSVRVLGRDLTAMGEDALARLRRDHMGVVFQSFHLIPTMTALENVATPLELARAADPRARALAMLGRVGLGPRAHHYPAQLSGGEQQRVALARALVGAPAILLADEPTGNLDSRTGAAVVDLLFDLVAASGTTLVLVTHAPDLAGRCDRVVAMRDGRIESDTPPP